MAGDAANRRATHAVVTLPRGRHDAAPSQAFAKPMTFRFLFAAPLFALLAPFASAQNDKITLTNGTVVEGVKVESYDMRYLRYSKGGSGKENVNSSDVAKVELGKFREEFARGLNDPGILVTMAKEKVGDKDLVMAQFAYLRAAELFFDSGKAAEAMGALDDLAKAIPDAGVGLDAFRLKCDYYMSQGAKGIGSAQTLAKKFAADATAKGWASAALEGQYMEVLTSKKAPKEFQAALRASIATLGGNPVLSSRANVELANSLRETKAFAEAARIYEQVAGDTKDVNARAGAMLGLGKVAFEQAGEDKEAFKKALLLFLRVRLESKDAWPGLQADALYHSVLAADKWRGPEFNLVMARCRNLLLNEYPNSEWAERARSGR